MRLCSKPLLVTTVKLFNCKLYKTCILLNRKCILAFGTWRQVDLNFQASARDMIQACIPTCIDTYIHEWIQMCMHACMYMCKHMSAWATRQHIMHTLHASYKRFKGHNVASISTRAGSYTSKIACPQDGATAADQHRASL